MLAVAAPTAGPRAAAGEDELPRLGLMLDPPRAMALPPTTGAGVVRLEARWDEVERVPGAFDWTALAPAVDAAADAGFRVCLALTGSHPHYLPEGGGPSPLVGGSLEAWLEFVRAASRTFAGRVTAFELGEGRPGGSAEEADVAALVLKQSTLAARAELGARGASAKLLSGALPVGALEWQRALWARDVAAYIDGIPLVLDVAADLETGAQRVNAFLIESLAHPPAPELWAVVQGGDRWDAAALAVAALGASAAVALYAPATDEELRFGIGLEETLATGFGPVGLGAVRLAYDAGPSPAGARVFGRFFNEHDFTTLIAYDAPPGRAGGAGADEVGLVVEGTTIGAARVLDPVTGATGLVRGDAVPGGRAFRVGSAPGPRLASFARPAPPPGLDLPPEELAVSTTRGLTAEEIIARHQERQRAQDDRLERWLARGRIDLHFKLAQGSSTIDVSIDSNYFWERGGELEWEQTTYYINGNRVGWKNIPELPLIQPEKVVTLPLDLTLDKTYSYRLAGEEEVSGRPAYVIAFEPAAADATRSLYRGRVWIDRENFARVRASVIQNNLSAPVLSNEETDRFGPHVGPDGETYWMFDRIEGQQVWNAAGRTFVVMREVTFDEIEINPVRASFEERRSRAYASKNQMLRDTDQGFRYLEQQPDGGRSVKQTTDTSQLFAAAGAFKDNSQDSVVPLAGVNYFNYDLWRKGIQLNALFAGVFGTVTASKPSLGGSRFDLTSDLTLSAIAFEDKVFEGEDEVEAESIETKSQHLTLRLGRPLGSFFKLNLIGGLAVRDYSHSDDGDDALDDFNATLPPEGPLESVLPQDHLETSGTVELEFNRRGYNVTGAYSRAARSDWEAFGLRSPTLGFGELEQGVFVPGSEPLHDSFSRWHLSTTKEWFLPHFQKLRAAVDLLDGADLDRFSRYQFSFFGDDRLNGFSGSGVRFDQGAIARLGYAFNLFEVIRFDLSVESAEVDDEAGEDGQSFTGAGLSANVVGPWKTVINLNYGYALSSDIPDLEGEQEFLLLVFKLF